MATGRVETFLVPCNRYGEAVCTILPLVDELGLGALLTSLLGEEQFVRRPPSRPGSLRCTLRVITRGRP